ncbi:tetratricopeptide repeat protein [Plantactinospora veratri]
MLDARLLDALGPDRAGQPRYRFHEVTRLFARERQRAEISATDWTAALERTASGWLALARRAGERLHCERFHLDDGSHPAVAAADPRVLSVATDRPVEWFEAEREALAALVPACADIGLATVARALAGSSADFYELRGYYDDWHRVMRAALEGCRRTGDRVGAATLLRGLGSCQVELDVDAALSTLRTARALAEELGDEVGATMARKELGYALALTGQLPEAEIELRAAAEALRRIGRSLVEARALTSLGFVLRQRGDTDEAVRVIRAAIAIARSRQDPFTQAYGLRGLAGALLAKGRDGDAERAARKAAELFARIGDPIGTAQSLRALGESLAGDPERAAEAEEALSTAAVVFRDRGNDWGLALTELSLGEVELRRGTDGAVERLERSLRYWTEEQVPALQARALVALADAAERNGDPAAGELLIEAYRLYRKLGVPQAAELAQRLGIGLPVDVPR